MSALDAVFSPRTVAVVGASRARESIGWSIVHNMIAAQFTGAIYPVNPKAKAIHSLKCYPSLAAIPDPIDLVVVSVPRAIVQAVVEEAIALGVRAFVVITAGYGETGEEGRALEATLRATIRAAGARMIGPNCMGVINTDAAVSLNATFAPTPATAGSIGFVSQSGALGVAILNVAAQLGIGLTQFVSMGNKADVSGNDLVEYWENDPATRVMCMYLESFGNPRRFTEIAKRVTRKKPILIVKSGRTAEGARAASSHTGAMAGTDVTVSAFLDQCGVLRADTIDELFDVARALDRCPLPQGPRVAIVTNAGGPAIMATDACINLGLQLAELSPATRAELASFLPSAAALGNPVDMIASATAPNYERTLAVVLADPGVDAAIVVNVTPLLGDPRDVLEAAARAMAHPAAGSKPVLAVMMAVESFYEGLKGAPHLPPVYRFPESAARALAQLVRYGEWRRRPEDEAPPAFAIDPAEVAATLGRPDAEGYLPADDAFRLLEALDIPVARWEVAGDREQALAAARRIGFPVVVKAISPGLVHKSEARAIELDLADESAVARACDALAGRFADAGLAVSGFFVQEMAQGGHETIFGVSTDPRFGPVLMFGLGGKYVEVFRDVRFGVTPLAPSEAGEMVRGIRGVKLLEGVRGDAPSDIALLEIVLLKLAWLVEHFPEISELDINPFLAAPAPRPGEAGASKAVDVRVRVSRAPQ
ncbi:MAG: acetate--CoA ligase family protein [Thermoanaerobaculia bacterium]